MSEISLRLPKEAQESVLRYIENRIKAFDRESLHRRFIDYERAYHLSTINPEEEKVDESDPKSGYYRYEDLDIGVVKTVAESDHAFYTSTLMSETPIFPVMADRQNKTAAQMMNSKIERDQKVQHWESNLSKCFKSGAKYDLCAAEIRWSKEIQENISSDESGEVETTETAWEGNKIKYLSPYNIVFDQTIPVDEVSRNGDHAGYTERMTQVRLWNYLRDLKSIDQDSVHDDKEMWESSPGGKAIFDPFVPEHVRKDKTAVSTETNWEFEFNLADPNKDRKDKPHYKNTYIVWTFYIRIIPEVLGINVPDKDSVQIWKIVVVNGQYVAAAFKMSDVHKHLNIVVAQPVMDELGLDTDSSSGSIIPMQKVIKQMLDRAFASLDRAISDRGLYDPEYVNESSINSKLPDAKIPLRKDAPRTLDNANAFDRAYKQLPFDSRHIQELFGIISTVIEFSQYSAGINQAQLGHFVKGNKTRSEFDTIMQNANSKQFMRALVLGITFLGPIKQIIKTNILQFQTQEEVFNPDTQTAIEIDPIELRKASLEFKLLDGLNPRAAALNGEFYQMFVQMVENMPQMQEEYNLPKMVAHWLQMQGGINMEQYKFTDEERQQMQQQMQAQAEAENAAPGNENPQGNQPPQ